MTVAYDTMLCNLDILYNWDNDIFKATKVNILKSKD